MGCRRRALRRVERSLHRRLAIEPLEDRRLLSTGMEPVLAAALPDPTVQIGNGPVPLVANRGDTVHAVIRITDNAQGLLSADFTITYDTALLDLANSDVTLSPYLTSLDWKLTPNVVDAAGTVKTSMYSPVALPTGTPELLDLAFHVPTNAMAGTSPLTFVMDGTSPSRLNGGHLPMTPVNGSITVGIRTWSGAGANDSWSTPANWVGNLAPIPGDQLVFAGSLRTSPVNDYPAGRVFRSISLSGMFTLSGNSVALDPAGATAIQSLAAANAVDVPIVLSSNGEILVSAGSVAMNGSIDTNGHPLTFSTASSTQVQVVGPINNPLGAKITVLGTGTVIVSGVQNYGSGTVLQFGSSGGLAPAGLTKGRTAALEMAVNDAYPADTTVSEGTLLVAADGGLPAGSVGVPAQAAAVPVAALERSAQRPSVTSTTVPSDQSTSAPTIWHAPRVAPSMAGTVASPPSAALRRNGSLRGNLARVQDSVFQSDGPELLWQEAAWLWNLERSASPRRPATTDGADRDAVEQVLALWDSILHTAIF